MLMLEELWYGNVNFESHTADDKEYKKETNRNCHRIRTPKVSKYKEVRRQAQKCELDRLI